MKILVTGGAGYIGSHFINFLLANGFSKEEIIVFDNLERGFKDSLPEEICLIKGDLRHRDEISYVFLNNKIDCVVHFAAYAYVGESMAKPELYFENNIIGGMLLLDAMRLGGCKNIIFSSSCATYGIPESIPINEQTPQSPVNPYGETKLIFEKILNWYSRIHGFNYVALRYFNAAGADFGIGEKHNPETHLIPLVIRSIIQQKEMNIFGNDYPTKDGTCIRDYIHVTDLANAHFLALKYLQNNGSSLKLNLGTGRGTSVSEIVSIAEDIIGKKAKVVMNERRAGDPAILVANADLAKKLLGWEAKKSIKETIKDAVDWEIKYSNLKNE